MWRLLAASGFQNNVLIQKYFIYGDCDNTGDFAGSYEFPKTQASAEQAL